MQDQPNGQGSAEIDWKQLGLVALVSIVVTLIGVAVSAQFGVVAFEPGTNGVAAPIGSTTIPQGSTTITPAGPTTTSPGGTEVAVLALAPETFDFGEEATALDVVLSNPGEVAAQWALAADHLGVGIAPANGELRPGESVTVTLTIDRAVIPEGEFSATAVLTWDGGEAVAPITAVSQGNPIIARPRANPATVEVDAGSGCSPIRTEITARITDASELERVFVRWSSDGSTTIETDMTLVTENDYEATIGPFNAPGSASVRVLAFDILGNAGGASVDVTVNACS